MNAERAYRLPRPLRRAFDRYRRRWRLVGTSSGLLCSLAVLTGAVGAAVLADRILRLSWGPRTIFLVAVLGAFAFCVIRWVLYRVVRRLRDREAAVRLGRRFPGMQEDLLSAVELSENGQSLQGVSRGLVASALEQIEHRTESVNPRSAVPLRPVLEAMSLFMVLVLGIGAGYLFRPEAIQNALHRLFRPGGAIPYFCYTRLRVLPGDQVVRTGDTVEVLTEVSGKRPDEARLEAYSAGDRLRVKVPCSDGMARWKSAPLFDDLRYRVRAGDAISDWYRVTVAPAPAVGHKSVLLRFPDYAGAEQHLVKDIHGPLEVIEGTAVSLRATPVDRGDEPKFRCEGRMTISDRHFAVKPDESGVLCFPLFEPTESGQCLIHLTDGFGLESRSPDSVSLKVTPDQRPRVRITSPDRDLVALPTDRIKVQGEAEDEFGLREIGLLYRTVEIEEDGTKTGRWGKRDLKPGGVKVRKLDAETELNLQELGIAPGDVLEYKGMASDYADQAILRRAYSKSYRIIVLSEMEHLERVLETLRELQVELLRKAAAETQEADRAAELAKRAQEGLVSEAARRAQDRQAELGRDTEKLARDFEALIPELLRNPSAPTSLLVNLEKIGRGVRSVALNPMAAMAGSLGKASQAEAGAQPQPLTEAQGFGREAAEQLEMLARIVERMQRLSILEKLATEAELLAARQREIKGQTLPVARKTAGSPIENLSQDLRSAVQRLAAMEKSIKSGVDLLGKNIEKAAGMLASSDPADAATAEQAGEKLESEKISERAERIAKKIGKNVLFSELPAQESVAESLEEVAKILRRESDADLIEAIIRELEEFIRRQKKINSDIELAIAKLRGARTSVAIGESQSRLGRDVSEHGSALYWLGQEIEGFRSESAEKLGAAANEMNLGAEDLYESSLPEGFEHGKKALALLEAAREKFDDELQELSDASQGTQLLEAMLLLQRILIAQKRINRQTAHADDTRLKDPAAFDRKVVALANRQGALRLDATRLREMLARFPDAAELVATAGDKMDESRSALAAGQTGGETRIVQRQIVAILEMLLGQSKQRMGQGLGSQRMMAMMQMMAGMQGGGFTGGTNAPILPESLDKTGEQDWRTVRSRFSEQLAAGHEEQYPVEYRDLLNAYFQRLRAEPAR